MSQDNPIYFLDMIRPKPGQGEEFFKHYMDSYAPQALERGLKLEHTWVNPPIWLEGDQSNTLFVVWSVKGVNGFWKSMVPPSAMDGSLAFWWRDADPMIAERSRMALCEAHDIASFVNV
jgi:hypothetical protein